MGLLKGGWSHAALVRCGHPSLKPTVLQSTHTSLSQTLDVPHWASGELHVPLTLCATTLICLADPSAKARLWFLHHGLGQLGTSSPFCPARDMVWSQPLPGVSALPLSRVATPRAGKARSCVAGWSCPLAAHRHEVKSGGPQEEQSPLPLLH